MQSGGEWKDFEVSARGCDFKAIDLPEEGRPPDFAGAVGVFATLPLSVSPPNGSVGEPVVLKISLKGDGNLDSVSAPRLLGAEGWRIYGPQEHYVTGSNIKTFEFTVVALKTHNNSPAASLSYFDPKQKIYTVLTWPAVPLSAVVTEEVSGLQVATKTGKTKESTLHTIAGVLWNSLKNFKGALIFLSFVGVLTVLLFLGTRFSLRRRHKTNERHRVALAEVWERLKTTPEKPSAFYAAASDVINARLAVVRGKPATLEDIESQLNWAVPSLTLREELAGILARRDELNYGAMDQDNLPTGERDAVFATLKRFCLDDN
jgi:hypothetical protein